MHKNIIILLSTFKPIKKYENTISRWKEHFGHSVDDFDFFLYINETYFEVRFHFHNFQIDICLLISYFQILFL